MSDLIRGLVLALLLLLPPIFGGDGEGDEGEVATDEPAGDEPSGDDPGEVEGAEGEEQPDEPGAEGAQDEGVEKGGEETEGEGAEARGEPRWVPYSRFKELVDRANTAERNLQLSLSRNGGAQEERRQQQEAEPMPEQYAKLDKGMGGYMRHYLNPISNYVLARQQETSYALGDLRDELRFYRGAGRTLTERQADLVEQARQGLEQKLRQPVQRSDVLNWLKGDPQHGKLFVDQRAVQTRALANGVVAARRQAGKLGGRGAVPRTRGERGTIDLNSLPRAERIRVFEREMANTPV